jgi:hypothetical protein
MDPRPAPVDTEAIRGLVAQCLDAIEARGESALEEACAAHPEHAAELRRRIGDLRDVGLLGDARANVPERMGEFELLERLGGGGMGVVYRARQESLGREVALKLIRPDQHFFPGARERFRREIEAVARLQHPGIAPIHAVGEEAGMPYFAMELVAGRSLADVLAALAGRDPALLSGADLARALGEAAQVAWDPDASWVETCLRVALQAAEALEHAHRRGVLHRDVKPSNLMLTPAGRVVLLDFGLASRAGSSRLTRTGSQLGSLPYMAPEQLAGTREPDARVDVYGLGVTLFEMLALAGPFDQPDAEAARRAIQAGDAPSLRGANRAVTWEVATIVETAMELDPARRYASCEAMARDLRHALEGRPIEARPAGTWLAARRWIARHPTRSVALALGTLLVVGGPLLFGLQESRARRQVEDALEIAESDRREAQLAREASERDFQRALEAVRKLLADVAVSRLDDVPQVQTLRADLLAEALRHYAGLQAERPDDLALRREIALQKGNLASLLITLGRNVEALDRIDDLIEQLEPLLGESPDDAALQGALCSAMARRAEILEFERRPGEALTAWQDARARVEALLEQRPDDGVLRRERAGLLAGFAKRIRRQGDAAGCEALLREALGDYAALADPTAQVREDAAGTWNELAQILGETGRVDDAREAHRHALALRLANTQEDPDDPQKRMQLGQTQSNLGFLEIGQGNAREARDLLAAGFANAEALTREHPDIPQYRYMLAALGSNLAAALSALDQQDEAERVLTRALDTALDLDEQFPGTHPYGLLVSSLLESRVVLLVESGHWSEAADAEKRARARLAPLLAAHPGDPRLGFTLARLCLSSARRELAAGSSGNSLAILRDFPGGPFAQEADLLRLEVGVLAACAASAAADERLDPFARDERVAHCAQELARVLERLEALGTDPWAGLDGVQHLELLADHEELPARLRASSR